MEELRIPFDMLIHPDMEALQKRDEFMSAMEKNVKIEKMDSDGIIADFKNEPSLDEWTAHHDTYTLKEVCEIAGITAEDLINADTPEIEG